MPSPAPRPHFPFVTRMAINLFNAGMLPNVTHVDVEPEFGYAARLQYTNETSRITRGNDVGLNPGAANDVVKDKAYAKHFLSRAGIVVPPGSTFLTRWWHARLGERYKSLNVSVRSVEDAM